MRRPLVPPKSLGQDALSTILGAPCRSRLHRSAVWDMRWVYLARLLSEVSNLGLGTDRSHAVGGRYRVCTRCLRPCWQTGHTDPGSPADTSGVLRSVASSRGGGRVVCPKRGRHCASFSWRTRLAKKPKCRSLWKPRGGTWSIRRRRHSTVSSVRVRKRWPRWSSLERKVTRPSSKATSRWLEMATRWVERAQEVRPCRGAWMGSLAYTTHSWSRTSASNRCQGAGSARARQRPAKVRWPWP